MAYLLKIPRRIYYWSTRRFSSPSQLEHIGSELSPDDSLKKLRVLIYSCDHFNIEPLINKLKWNQNFEVEELIDDPSSQLSDIVSMLHSEISQGSVLIDCSCPGVTHSTMHAAVKSYTQKPSEDPASSRWHIIWLNNCDTDVDTSPSWSRLYDHIDVMDYSTLDVVLDHVESKLREYSRSSTLSIHSESEDNISMKQDLLPGRQQRPVGASATNKQIDKQILEKVEGIAQGIELMAAQSASKHNELLTSVENNKKLSQQATTQLEAIGQATYQIINRNDTENESRGTGDDSKPPSSPMHFNITENLTCPVCNQLYKNPKFLSCYHSYCEECLEKIWKLSRITCPECRNKTAVPIGGVKDLPDNTLINRIMKGLEDQETRNKALKLEIEQLRESSKKYQNKLETENKEFKLRIEQLRKSSKRDLEVYQNILETESEELKLKIEQMRELSKNVSANKVEINQLNGTIAELEIKHNEVKTENKMLKRRIEQLRELSKKDQEHQTKLETESKQLKLEIERLSELSKNEELIDISDVKIAPKILKYGSYYVGYEAVYCGKQYIAKKEHSQNIFSKKLMKHEWKLLAHLNHPHITQQLAVLDKPKSTLVLLMEQMWMSLSEFLTNKHSHHDKISILRDAACGLHHIHEKDIVHCDLTADNILLTENLTAKLANFGRATRGQQIFLKYFPENLDHVPPEILVLYSKANCSTKVDVFSFGCVIIHTFIEESPVPDFDKHVETSEVGRYKKHSEVERRSICLKKFKNNCNSTKLHDTVLKCLQDNPDCRPTAATLLSLLEDQLTTIVPNTYKYVEDVCPEVSLKRERCTASINMLLEERLRLLTALNVSGYNITDQGVDMIAAVLLESISLTKLDLSNTMLSSVKATKINSALKNIKPLKVLNISNNDIDDGAADSIAAVVCSNSFIEEMNLSHNKMTCTGVLNIANALSESIKVFDISSNFIASDDAADLATALSKCPVLQELNISENLLRLTEILTIAQSFRLHPTLQSLDLSGNAISFSSAAEFIVDVILSVNQTLASLNVCSRNIRPRCIDYLSASGTNNNSAMFMLQNLYSLQCSSLETNFIKVVETCPVSSKDIISYYADHLGGVFYNKHHNFAIVIPPSAVTQGDCVEIQGTANYCGPYTIPDGFYPISSYFWVSANYTFKAPVYLIMSHYAKIRNLEDVSSLHVLHKCAHDPNTTLMSTITDGVYFDMEISYCVLATDHFCSYCQAKSVKHIPERLLACYCTYESPDGSLVAEVCFCPSNSECKKVVLEQCEKRNTKLQRSDPFIVADKDELYISSIDLKNIKDNEWIVTEWGKLTVTHLCDFEYWEIFRGFTVDQIKEREESFEYPPRLQIKCEQIDDTKPLIFSFEVSKRSKNMKIPIAKFSLVKKVSAPPETTSKVQATATLPSDSDRRSQNEMRESLKQSHVYANIDTSPQLRQSGILETKPEMKDLIIIVIPLLKAEWKDVAFLLNYKPPTINSIKQSQHDDPKKCCRELFEDWLETNHGVSPKDWGTLLNTIAESEDFTKTVEDILKQLEKKFIGYITS